MKYSQIRPTHKINPRWGRMDAKETQGKKESHHLHYKEKHSSQLSVKNEKNTNLL